MAELAYSHQEFDCDRIDDSDYENDGYTSSESEAAEGSDSEPVGDSESESGEEGLESKVDESRLDDSNDDGNDNKNYIQYAKDCKLNILLHSTEDSTEMSIESGRSQVAHSLIITKDSDVNTEKEKETTFLNEPHQENKNTERNEIVSMVCNKEDNEAEVLKMNSKSNSKSKENLPETISASTLSLRNSKVTCGMPAEITNEDPKAKRLAPNLKNYEKKARNRRVEERARKGKRRYPQTPPVQKSSISKAPSSNFHISRQSATPPEQNGSSLRPPSKGRALSSRRTISNQPPAESQSFVRSPNNASQRSQISEERSNTSQNNEEIPRKNSRSSSSVEKLDKKMDGFVKILPTVLNAETKSKFQK